MKTTRSTSLLAVIMVMIFGISGCKKASNDNYYVRYEVYSISPTYMGQDISISVNTDSGVKNYETEVPTHGTCCVFNEQYGPVPNGFETKVITSSNPSSWAAFNINIKIYVSKNMEPFVLKAEITGRNGAETSYVIDF